MRDLEVSNDDDLSRIVDNYRPVCSLHNRKIRKSAISCDSLFYRIFRYSQQQLGAQSAYWQIGVLAVVASVVATGVIVIRTR